MTIQESLKTGKPFKRKSDEKWIPANSRSLTLTTDDLLAEDWEVDRSCGLSQRLGSVSPSKIWKDIIKTVDNQERRT